jgi:hypothetical protein
MSKWFYYTKIFKPKEVLRSTWKLNNGREITRKQYRNQQALRRIKKRLR